jgi:hypothetical protein
VAKAFQEARLERKEEEIIISAATGRHVYGGNTDLRRAKDDYAESPIIAHLKKNMPFSGTIYVAYVPNNCGKTTACYAAMDKPYCRRGVAFSPDVGPTPYFDSVLSYFGFNAENPPPEGFMTRLLAELQKGDVHPELENNLLILDNFMPFGFNDEDSRFLHNLKGQIKGKNVTALVFTPSKEAACRLLSQNNLGCIVPLASNKTIVDLKKANDGIDPNEPLDFNWEKLVSMVWDKDELKKAIEHSPSFLGLKEAARNKIVQRFDSVYNGLSRTEKEDTNPVSFLRMFEVVTQEITTPRGGSGTGTSGATGRTAAGQVSISARYCKSILCFYRSLCPIRREAKMPHTTTSTDHLSPSLQ